MEWPSKSSSLRRLLDFFRPSAAVNGASACGVEDRDMYPEWLFPSDTAVVLAEGNDVDVDDTVGESILMSSLIVEDPARGNDGGGV